MISFGVYTTTMFTTMIRILNIPAVFQIIYNHRVQKMKITTMIFYSYTSWCLLFMFLQLNGEKYCLKKKDWKKLLTWKSSEVDWFLLVWNGTFCSIFKFTPPSKKYCGHHVDTKLIAISTGNVVRHVSWNNSLFRSCVPTFFFIYFVNF